VEEEAQGGFTLVIPQGGDLSVAQRKGKERGRRGGGGLLRGWVAYALQLGKGVYLIKWIKRTRFKRK